MALLGVTLPSAGRSATVLAMRGRKRVELYRWLVTADPPICGRGKPVVLLNTCERRRRDEECLCRFDVVEIADDWEAAGAGHLIEWLNDDLEPEDVEALSEDLARALKAPPDDADLGAVERSERVLRRLRRLVEAGVGISDEYADDLD
jgi:hypothetical protein